MDINIRSAVLDNFKGLSSNEVNTTIADSVNNNDENILPGLGVLFELVWNQSDSSFKKAMVDKITSSL